MKTYLVYMTATDAAEAERVGSVLVERRLAACVNILAPVRTLYWWDGAVQNEQETAFVAKTAEDRLEALIAAVQEVHSYDVPCIVALPMERGSADFLEWLVETTRPRH